MRAGWMRPSHDQPFERHPGHLAAERVEAGEDHGLGRVVDDQVDAGRHLEGADVPSLAADDPPLHLVVGQHDDRDGGLGHVVRRRPLDGHADDPLGLLVGLLAGLVLDALDDVGGLDAGLVLHHPHQLFARLLGGQAGDLLELAPLLLEHALELALTLLGVLLADRERAVELGQVLVPAGEIVGPLFEVVFLLGEAALLHLELRPALAGELLELAARLEKLLLGGDLGLAHLGFALAPGVFHDRRGVLARLIHDATPFLADGAPSEDQDQDRDRGEKDRRGQNNDFGVHRLPLIVQRDRRDLGGPSLRRGGQKGIPRMAVWAMAFRT